MTLPETAVALAEKSAGGETADVGFYPGFGPRRGVLEQEIGFVLIRLSLKRSSGLARHSGSRFRPHCLAALHGGNASPLVCPAGR